METIILYLYHIQIRFAEEPPAEAVEQDDHLKDATPHYVNEDPSYTDNENDSKD